MRTRTVPVVTALPDLPTRARIAALTGIYGASLAGAAGPTSGVMGYDRGDPVHSFGGPVQGAPSPTIGYAQVHANNVYQPTPTFQDQPLATPELDPYNAMLLARLQQS